jgi:HSP20 family protein
MAASGTRAPLGMPMDAYRGEDGSYHVEADLPGADPDSLEVTVEHGVLMIRAERTPHYGDSEQVIAAERPHGPFAGSCPSARAWTRRTSPTASCT